MNAAASPRLNRARIATSPPETIRFPTTDIRTSHTINIPPTIAGQTNRTYQGLQTCRWCLEGYKC